jgi:hypothetical protein
LSNSGLLYVYYNEEFRNDFSIVDEYQLNLIKFRYVYPEITEVTNINVKSNKNKLRISRN